MDFLNICQKMCILKHLRYKKVGPVYHAHLPSRTLTKMVNAHGGLCALTTVVNAYACAFTIPVLSCHSSLL